MPKSVYPRHQEKKPHNTPKHIDTLKSRVRRKDPTAKDSPSKGVALPRRNKAGKKPPQQSRQVQMIHAQMSTGRKLGPLHERIVGGSTLGKSLQTTKSVPVTHSKAAASGSRNPVRSSGKGRNPKR